jgi:Cytochrome P450
MNQLPSQADVVVIGGGICGHAAVSLARLIGLAHATLQPDPSATIGHGPHPLASGLREMLSGARKMTVASAQITRDVPLMPGGQRVLGHALAFGRDPLALFQQAREHGDVVRIRFGPFHVYVLNSPSVIRKALVGEARKLGKGLNFGRAKRLIGNGLVMSEGESHHLQRRLMQPAFHRAEIARYAGTMRDVAVPRISAWPDGGTLASDREMRSITLTVLTRTLLSSDIGADAIDEIERLLRVLLSELVARGISANVPGLAWAPTRSNRRFGAADRRLRALLTDIIDGYRRVGTDNGDLSSILPVRPGHQELHRRGFRLDRVNPAAQRHRRPLAATARRRRRRAPRGQQHSGAERAADHRDPPLAPPAQTESRFPGHSL